MKLFGCIWSNKPLRLLSSGASPFTIVVRALLFAVIYTLEDRERFRNSLFTEFLLMLPKFCT